MARTYEPIQTQVLGSTQATVTFSAIPQTYTDLVLIVDGDLTTGGHDLRLRFNSDSGTNYSRTIFYNNAGTRNANSDNIITASFSGANSGSYATINIFNYADSTTYTTTLQRGGYVSGIDSLTTGLWRNTAAITTIECGNTGSTTWVVGSSFTLYGIKAA